MNLNETDSENYDWNGGVYQLEVTDRVQAGPEGISNLQASVLAKRTRNLHQRTQKVETEKAPLASPAFTGVPTVPTPAPGTNTKQVVNAEFVLAAFAALINGSPDSLNALNELAAAMNNDPNFAATVANNLGGKLNRNFDNILDAAAARAALGLSNMLSADSPEFTGVPKAPTAAAGTNTTQIANTAFVQAALAAKVAKASNLSDLANRQTALNNLANAAAANTNEFVLTKDTATGDIILKAISSSPYLENYQLSKNLNAGTVVQLNDAGKLEDIFKTTVAEALPSGTVYKTTSRPGACNYATIKFDPLVTNRFVIVWYEDSMTCYGCVGTIAENGSITYGAIAQLVSYVYNSYFQVCFSPTEPGKFVLFYSNPTGMGKVITISGTSLVTTNAAVSLGKSLYEIRAEFICTGEYILLAGIDGSNNLYYYTIVVSGTTIIATLSTNYMASKAYSNHWALRTHPTDPKLFFMCVYDTGASFMSMYAGRINASDNVSYYMYQNPYLNGSADNCDFCYDPFFPNKYVMILRSTSDNSVWACMGTWDGGSLSSSIVRHTPIQVKSSNANSMNISYVKGVQGKVLIGYDDKVVVGTINYTTNTITLGTVYTVGSGNVSVFDVLHNDPFNAGRFIRVSNFYANQIATELLQVGCQYSNIKSANIVGVLQKTGITNDIVQVMTLGGVDETKTGMVRGQKYYVQDDGTVSTVNTTNSVYIGTALTATKLQLKSIA